MNRSLTSALVAVLAVSGASAPSFASAQAYRSYGPDPCHAARRHAGNTGAVVGGVTGAVLGGAVLSHSVGGALLGGAVGAVAGHAIGKSSVTCVAYPRRISYHRTNCRWVEEDRDGHRRGFEVCRGHDGIWRPSGRA